MGLTRMEGIMLSEGTDPTTRSKSIISLSGAECSLGILRRSRNPRVEKHFVCNVL